MSKYTDAISAIVAKAHWRLGESSGTLVNDFTIGNSGDYIGTPTLGEDSFLPYDRDTSIVLNGTDQYATIDWWKVVLPYGNATNFSISALVKLSSISIDQAIFTQSDVGSDTDYSIYLGFSTSDNDFIFDKNPTSSGGPSLAGINVEVDRVYHIIYIQDGTDTYWYIDGVLTAINIAQVYNGLAVDADTINGIGALVYTNGNVNLFNGGLDEVIVFNKTITTQDVHDIYKASRLSYRPTSYPDGINNLEPLAYWRLGESAGTVAVDELGLNDGTYIISLNSVPGLLRLDSNTAISTNGIDNYVDFNAVRTEISTLGTGTVSFIAKFPSGGKVELSGGRPSYDPRWIRFGISESGAYYHFRDTNVGYGVKYFTVETDNTFLPDTVYVMTFVRDSTEGCLIYVNGLQEDASVTNGITAGEWFSSAEIDYFAIQSIQSPTTVYHEGTADELVIYDYTLLPAEILELYEATNLEYFPLSFYEYANYLQAINYWRLGDVSPSTTVVDETTNNDGTYTNAPTLEQSSLIINDADYSVAFNGTDEYATLLPGFPAESQISAFAIIQPNNVNTNMAIFGDYNAAGSGDDARVSLGLRDTGNWTITIGNGTTNHTDTTIAHNLIAGQTYIIGIVVDVTDVKIYVNGIEEVNITSAIALGTLGTIPWTTSKLGDFAGHYFDGKIDEISLFDYILNPAQITELHRLTGNGVNDVIMANSPEAYYKFDEVSGAPQDSSGNAHHLTLYGATTPNQEFPIPSKKALQFDGGRADSNTAAAMDFANYSYCFFYKLEQGMNGKFLIYKGSTTTDYDLGVYSGGDPNNLSLSVYHDQLSGGVNTTVIHVTALSQRKRWHHVAVTYDGTDIRTYYDGIFQATEANTALEDSGDTLRFSHWYNQTTGGVLQTLVDAALFSTAISEADIKAIVDNSNLFTFNKNVHRDYIVSLTPEYYWTFNDTYTDYMGVQDLTAGVDANTTYKGYLVVGDDSVSQWIGDSTTGSYAFSAGTVGQFGRTEAFSISGIIQPNILAADAQRHLFGCFSGGKGMYAGLDQTQHLVFRMTNTDTTNDLFVISDNSILSSAVSNVAYTYDGSGSASGVKLYADGVLLDQTATYDTLSSEPVYTGDTHIGAESLLNAAANKIDCIVAHLAVHSDVLPLLAVTNLHDTTMGGSATIPTVITVIFNKLSELFTTKSSAQNQVSYANKLTANFITKQALFVVNTVFNKVTDEIIANNVSTQQKVNVNKVTDLINANLHQVKQTFFVTKLIDTFTTYKFIYGYAVNIKIASAYFSTYAASFTEISNINKVTNTIKAKDNTVTVVASIKKSAKEIISNSFSSAIIASITSSASPFVGISFTQVSKNIFNISNNPILGKDVSALMLSNINKATITTITYPVSFTNVAIQTLASDLIQGLDFAISKSGQREIISINCFINKNESKIHFINQAMLNNMQVTQSFSPKLNITSVFENDNAIMTTVEINTEL